MEHKEVPVGLVKRTPFKKASPYPMRNEDIDRRYHLNSDCLMRISGLSKAQVLPSYGHWEVHAERAVDAVYTVLRNNKYLYGKPFTIGDGTNWIDAKATDEFGSDILFINVYWVGNDPVVTLCLGWSRTYKTSKLMRLWDNDNWITVNYSFKLNMLFPEVMGIVKQAIKDAIDGKGRGDLYSLGAMNAYETTIDPSYEYPIAAATYLDDVVWYVDRPYRHHHVIHSPEYLEFKNGLPRSPRKPPAEQGFLTNHGNFVNRKRAMLLVMQNPRTPMLVSTEPVTVGLAYLPPSFTSMERKFFGLKHSLDHPYYGLAMAGTDLFSEDIW